MLSIHQDPAPPQEDDADPDKKARPHHAEEPALKLHERRLLRGLGCGVEWGQPRPDGLRSRRLTDRTVLKQTLLTGEPQIGSKEACDKMRARVQGLTQTEMEGPWQPLRIAVSRHFAAGWGRFVFESPDGRVK